MNLTADTLSRAVALFSLRIASVDFHPHRIVNPPAPSRRGTLATRSVSASYTVEITYVQLDLSAMRTRRSTLSIRVPRLRRTG